MTTQNSTASAAGASPASQTARLRVRAGRRRSRIVLFGLVAALIGVFFASFMVGRYPIGPVELVQFLGSKIFAPDTVWPREYDVVVFTIRLPRILGAALVGACLSVAVLAFQALFKNPMAAPTSWAPPRARRSAPRWPSSCTWGPASRACRPSRSACWRCCSLTG